MQQFIVGGFCLMLHVKLKFTSLATSLAFGIFTSNDRRGEFMVHVI
jgi:hypothetical protein